MAYRYNIFSINTLESSKTAIGHCIENRFHILRPES